MTNENIKYFLFFPENLKFWRKLPTFSQTLSIFSEKCVHFFPNSDEKYPLFSEVLVNIVHFFLGLGVLEKNILFFPVGLVDIEDTSETKSNVVET